MLNRRGDVGLKRASVPGRVAAAERIRRVPEALLLTAGYYGSKAPVVRTVLSRI